MDEYEITYYEGEFPGRGLAKTTVRASSYDVATSWARDTAPEGWAVFLVVPITVTDADVVRELREELVTVSRQRDVEARNALAQAAIVNQATAERDKARAGIDRLTRERDASIAQCAEVIRERDAADECVRRMKEQRDDLRERLYVMECTCAECPKHP